MTENRLKPFHALRVGQVFILREPTSYGNGKKFKKTPTKRLGGWNAVLVDHTDGDCHRSAVKCSFYSNSICELVTEEPTQ